MAKQSDPALKERVRQWQAAAGTLQAVRDENTRGIGTARALQFFRGAVLAALPTHPPRPWSGLVEQQRWFGRLPRA